MHRTAIAPRLRRIGAALLVAGALACAGSDHRGTTVLAKVPEHVVILPFNVVSAMPAELKANSPEVWTALETYLRSQGSQLKTLAYPTARALWATSVKEAQAEQNETKRAAAVGRAFVAKLKPYAEFDAVIFPSLFIQRAALSGTRAKWDGTEQTLEIDAGAHGAPVPSDAPIEGAAPAASLHVVVLDAKGEQIQESQTGIALLVTARVSRADDSLATSSYQFVPRKDPFADPAVLHDAVARALSPYIPAPSSVGAGEHRRQRRDRDQQH